jgi:hypothetical protein
MPLELLQLPRPFRTHRAAGTGVPPTVYEPVLRLAPFSLSLLSQLQDAGYHRMWTGVRLIPHADICDRSFGNTLADCSYSMQVCWTRLSVSRISSREWVPHEVMTRMRKIRAMPLRQRPLRNSSRESTATSNTVSSALRMVVKRARMRTRMVWSIRSVRALCTSSTRRLGTSVLTAWREFFSVPVIREQCLTQL